MKIAVFWFLGLTVATAVLPIKIPITSLFFFGIAVMVLTGVEIVEAIDNHHD